MITDSTISNIILCLYRSYNVHPAARQNLNLRCGTCPRDDYQQLVVQLYMARQKLHTVNRLFALLAASCKVARIIVSRQLGMLHERKSVATSTHAIRARQSTHTTGAAQ